MSNMSDPSAMDVETGELKPVQVFVQVKQEASTATASTATAIEYQEVTNGFIKEEGNVSAAGAPAATAQSPPSRPTVTIDTAAIFALFKERAGPELHDRLAAVMEVLSGRLPVKVSSNNSNPKAEAAVLAAADDKSVLFPLAFMLDPLLLDYMLRRGKENSITIQSKAESKSNTGTGAGSDGDVVMGEATTVAAASSLTNGNSLFDPSRPHTMQVFMRYPQRIAQLFPNLWNEAGSALRNGISLQGVEILPASPFEQGYQVFETAQEYHRHVAVGVLGVIEATIVYIHTLVSSYDNSPGTTILPIHLNFQMYCKELTTEQRAQLRNQHRSEIALHDALILPAVIKFKHVMTLATFHDTMLCKLQELNPSEWFYRKGGPTTAPLRPAITSHTPLIINSLAKKFGEEIVESLMKRIQVIGAKRQYQYPNPNTPFQDNQLHILAIAMVTDPITYESILNQYNQQFRVGDGRRLRKMAVQKWKFYRQCVKYYHQAFHLALRENKAHVRSECAIFKAETKVIKEGPTGQVLCLGELIVEACTQFVLSAVKHAYYDKKVMLPISITHAWDKTEQSVTNAGGEKVTRTYPVLQVRFAYYIFKYHPVLKTLKARTEEISRAHIPRDPNPTGN